MSNIDKRAFAMTKELATLMGERFSMNPVSCKLLNEAWKKEFPDEVAIAERMLALLDELEAKDNRINRLEAIVSVAEQRNALMREWKRALKVPCDLVDDQVPVVIHGMVIRLERLKETEEKLAAAAAMLQGADGNSPVITDCSCRTCRPVTFTDSRFVVCPDCGNKRCPHANDHRNACTGSNELGQEGSA
ncbi:hypothetical protein RM361_004459 [Enterobacter kobei]|uniref:hypothetical protein n=1 Tax=Enterobacter kobei TaxID=208224 RepID=UPI0022F09B78|nr:hypothetical protein [Enterobacter kobei]ELE9225113.1 hypothetical protein [Enterobacter kobei]MDA4610691.1 ead/Ea22-like family protein [Enterobacter kobei]